MKILASLSPTQLEGDGLDCTPDLPVTTFVSLITLGGLTSELLSSKSNSCISPCRYTKPRNKRTRNENLQWI